MANYGTIIGVLVEDGFRVSVVPKPLGLDKRSNEELLELLEVAIGWTPEQLLLFNMSQEPFVDACTRGGITPKMCAITCEAETFLLRDAADNIKRVLKERGVRCIPKKKKKPLSVKPDLDVAWDAAVKRTTASAAGAAGAGVRK